MKLIDFPTFKILNTLCVTFQERIRLHGRVNVFYTEKFTTETVSVAREHCQQHATPGSF